MHVVLNYADNIQSKSSHSSPLESMGTHFLSASVYIQALDN